MDELIASIEVLAKFSSVPLAGLVTLGVLAIYRGTWTPERVTRKLEKDRDDWQASYELERKAHEITRGQLGQVINTGRTTERVLTSITESDGG